MTVHIDPNNLASKKLLSASIAVLRLNWTSSAIVFALLMGLVLLKELMQKNSIGGGIPDAILWSALAGPIFRTLITGETGISRADSKAGMWLRLYVLGLVAYAPATAIAVYFEKVGGVPLMSILGLVLLIVMGGLFGSFVAAFLGTWVVSPAIQAEHTLADAIRRGFATWQFSLPRLLGIPFILNSISALVIVVGGTKLTSGDILSEQNFVNLPELLFYLTVSATQIVITAIIAVIVARAYLLALKLNNKESSMA